MACVVFNWWFLFYFMVMLSSVNWALGKIFISCCMHVFLVHFYFLNHTNMQFLRVISFIFLFSLLWTWAYLLCSLCLVSLGRYLGGFALWILHCHNLRTEDQWAPLPCSCKAGANKGILWLWQFLFSMLIQIWSRLLFDLMDCRIDQGLSESNLKLVSN